MPARNSDLAADAPRPEIIVDFLCEQGLLFLKLKNIGARSGYKVSTKFDKPLYGLDGQKSISEMQLFRRLEFIPPGKEFVQLVDPVVSWFKRRHPSRLTIQLTYRDREGHRFEERIVHDLRIYQDLGHTNLRRSGGSDGVLNS
jgi:hypothetical protein